MTSTPNKRNIRKWVKALRSGDYEQTRHALASVDDDGRVGYCCLGVGCDVSGLVPLRARPGLLVSDLSCSTDLYFGDRTGVLPDEVKEWLGIDDCDPMIAGKTLSLWNDSEGADFNKIADLIEAEYLTA